MIRSFIDKHKVNCFTVIADAAMISTANVEELQKNNIHYIVGVRLGNLSNELISTIDKNLCREDAKNIRVKTDNGHLICSYSNRLQKNNRCKNAKSDNKQRN